MPTTNPRLPFEIDDTLDPTPVTGRAGVPLVIELFRQLGVAQAIEAHVPVKQRQRGWPPAQVVESLIALSRVKGDSRGTLPRSSLSREFVLPVHTRARRPRRLAR